MLNNRGNSYYDFLWTVGEPKLPREPNKEAPKLQNVNMVHTKIQNILGRWFQNQSELKVIDCFLVVTQHIININKFIQVLLTTI